MSVPSHRHFHLVANTRSGRGSGSTLPELARRVAQELGASVHHHEGESLDDAADRAVVAAKKDGGVVIGAGGDGTLRAVAERAAREKVAFAAIPCGTFNFFARTHRIPEDPEAALRLAMSGEERPVRLGRVNDRYFLINASLGLYAKSIQAREKSTRRWGRARLVNLWATAKTLLIGDRPLDVDLVTGSERKRVRTLSIFVGNNALQLRDLALDVARFMKLDLLAVVVLRPVTVWEMCRILWRGLSKSLEREERLDTFSADYLEIGLSRRRVAVALDGELFAFDTPLEIRAMPEALRMILPPREEK